MNRLSCFPSLPTALLLMAQGRASIKQGLYKRREGPGSVVPSRNLRGPGSHINPVGVLSLPFTATKALGKILLFPFAKWS